MHILIMITSSPVDVANITFELKMTTPVLYLGGDMDILAVLVYSSVCIGYRPREEQSPFREWSVRNRRKHTKNNRGNHNCL